MSDIFGGPPDDEGYDPLGYPEDYAEVEDPYGFWYGDMPEAWWYDEVTLRDDYDGEHTLQANQWWEASLQGDEITNMLYSMDVLDIIHELEEYGLWDSDDWDRWRELYGEQ